MLRGQLSELERALTEVKLTLWPQEPLSASAAPIHIDEEKVRRLIRVRRLRERQLGAELFSDPAWDILLEALASELGRSRVSVSRLCHASAVSGTTALRWINKLEQDGWLARVADRFDPRREWVELTPRASERLRSYFENVWPSLLPL